MRADEQLAAVADDRARPQRRLHAGRGRSRRSSPGSLSLLADAGHNLSDVVALSVAAGAVLLARRPATPNRSFGFRRAEILAALVNAVSLIVIAIIVFVGAARRFADPPDVPGGWLIAVATVGLLVNLIGAVAVFRPGGRRPQPPGRVRPSRRRRARLDRRDRDRHRHRHDRLAVRRPARRRADRHLPRRQLVGRAARVDARAPRGDAARPRRRGDRAGDRDPAGRRRGARPPRLADHERVPLPLRPRPRPRGRRLSRHPPRDRAHARRAVRDHPHDAAGRPRARRRAAHDLAGARGR